MRLLLIRHATADDPPGCRFSGDDASRPLSNAGKRKMRTIANRLRLLERRVDCFASSGLVRSDQTAELLARAYRRPPPVRLSALAPGGPFEAIVDWLQQYPADAVVALVGHEPGLGRLTGLLVAGRPSRAVAFKKGGVCMIEFDAAPGPAMGMLRWALTPAQIGRLKA